MYQPTSVVGNNCIFFYPDEAVLQREAQVYIMYYTP